MPNLDAFDWSVAPLARFEVVIATAIIYALAAVTARLYLRRTTAPKASGASYVLAAHSLVLCAASFIMCAGAVRAVLEPYVAKRLAGAERDIQRWGEYDYVMINEDLETAYEELKAILLTERLSRRAPSLGARVDALLEEASGLS